MSSSCSASSSIALSSQSSSSSILENASATSKSSSKIASISPSTSPSGSQNDCLAKLELLIQEVAHLHQINPSSNSQRIAAFHFASSFGNPSNTKATQAQNCIEGVIGLSEDLRDSVNASTTSLFHQADNQLEGMQTFAMHIQKKIMMLSEQIQKTNKALQADITEQDSVKDRRTKECNAEDALHAAQAAQNLAKDAFVDLSNLLFLSTFLSDTLHKRVSKIEKNQQEALALASPIPQRASLVLSSSSSSLSNHLEDEQV